MSPGPGATARKLVLAAAVVVLLAAVAVVAAFVLRGGELSELPEALANLPARILTRWAPPAPGEAVELAPRERRALEGLGPRLAARVVWASNRDGDHDLYVHDFRDGTTRRITDHPHVDTHPRYSPDGSRIVFLRSQRPWVSFRETDAWDVWVMDADGGDPRRVARGGHYPSWAPDGDAVVYMRGSEVVRHRLRDDRVETLFRPGPHFPAHGIGDPALAGDGVRLALNVFGRAVAIRDLEEETFQRVSREPGCEPWWGPGDRYLVWIDQGAGNGGTRVMRRRLGAPEEVFIDLPGEYSHEYFPALSDDGRWMVWGASEGGHEHDRADYEIFVWPVGAPRESAVRLTFHSGNDQWPDIHVDAPDGSRE